MTAYSSPAPGAGAPTAKRPPAAIPQMMRAPIAGVPRPTSGVRPTMGYSNPGAAATKVTPSQSTPYYTQMNPRTFGAAAARPRMPSPFTQGAPPAGAPRPMMMMTRGAAPSPTPRMPGRMAVVPPNTTRAVGPAVPSARGGHMPMPSPPTQGAAKASPAVANPLKRKQEASAMAMGPSVPPAMRHAPLVPTKTAAPMPPRHAQQGAPTTQAQTPRPVPVPVTRVTPFVGYRGVLEVAGKGWMARVMDPKRGGAARDIGPFESKHMAALAHDRVTIAGAVGGSTTPLNFNTGFHLAETTFLRLLCREPDRDICGMVEKDEYEGRYEEFLRKGYRAVLKTEDWDGNPTHCDGFYLDIVLDYFISRAGEIGEEILNNGGKKHGAEGQDPLEKRFVEMHRNRALCPEWRDDHHRQKAQQMMMQQNQNQQMMQQNQNQQIRQRQIQQQQQRMMMVQRQQQLDGHV